MEFDLVFEGDGAKGLAFVGALQALERNGHAARRVIGTSAGSITALLVAAGYNADECMEAINERTSDGRSRFGVEFSDSPDDHHLKNVEVDRLVFVKYEGDWVLVLQMAKIGLVPDEGSTVNAYQYVSYPASVAQQMTQEEVLAVLAHEVGHWKKKHVLKRIVMTEIMALIGIVAGFRLLQGDWLSDLLRLGNASFFAKVVILGFLASIVTFPLTPLFSYLSRRDERESDQFARELTGDPGAMASALVKLSNENLSNLRASSTMFRGIEIILKGRDPREAWVMTQRICGV